MLLNLSSSTVNVNTGVFSPSLAAGQVTVGTAGNYQINLTAYSYDWRWAYTSPRCRNSK